MRDDAMRLAVLIDAENAHAKIIDQLMAEAAKLGIATVKRIYGNFRSGNTSIWSDDLLRDHSIKPMHQINNTKGKKCQRYRYGDRCYGSAALREDRRILHRLE